MSQEVSLSTGPVSSEPCFKIDLGSQPPLVAVKKQVFREIDTDCANRILVVEDDFEIRDWMSSHLKECGFEILESADGRDVLGIAKSKRPRAIFLDVCLAGMSGLKLLSELKAYSSTQEIPVVMVSADGSTRTAALELGASCFVSKPFLREDMLQALAEVDSEFRSNKKMYRIDTGHDFISAYNVTLPKPIDNESDDWF